MLGYQDATYLLDRDAQLQVASSSESGSGGSAGRSATARFTRPFIAHASMAPSCAVAVSDDSRMTVWSHSQGIYGLRSDLTRVLGVGEDSVEVIHMEGPGVSVTTEPTMWRWMRHCWLEKYRGDRCDCSGHGPMNSPGSRTRLPWWSIWLHRWMRPDESWTGRTMAGVILTARGLDSRTASACWLLATSILRSSRRCGARFPSRPAACSAMPIPMYDVGAADVVGHLVPINTVRTSALRGLGTHANVFAIESFMDELAELADADPVEFRLRHLTDERARDVIEAVVELSGAPIGRTDANGHGYGLAFARYKNTSCYAAVVAEVEAESEVTAGQRVGGRRCGDWW